MKRTFRRIMLVIMTCLALSSVASLPAHAATNLLTPTQEANAKPILQKAFPGITDAKITQLLRNSDFVKAASQVVSIKYGPMIQSSLGTKSVATSRSSYATLKCLKGTAQAKASGIFGTLFSFTTTLTWCYDGNKVYYQTHSVKPDVTMYGGTFGWSYEGYWQDLNRHYYTWNGHPSGGYVVQAFPQFDRCLTKLGCLDQKFGDVGFWGHYNGTYTARRNFN